MTKESPFMMFWRSINLARRECGSPELSFGPAMDKWQEEINQAVFDRDVETMRRLRAMSAVQLGATREAFNQALRDTILPPPVSSLDMVRQAAADAQVDDLSPDQVAG